MPTTVEKEVARAYHALVKAQNKKAVAAREVARAYHALVKAQGKVAKHYPEQCLEAIVTAREAVEVALSKVVAEQGKPEPEGGETK